MKKTTKILSVVLAISMVLSVAVALAFSAFAAQGPAIEVKQVSKTGNEIVVNIDLKSGTFNSLDLAFDMKGVKCTKIEAGAASSSSGAMLISNPEATGDASHISMVAMSGMKAGTIAVVTLSVTADDYSFAVKSTSCCITDESFNNVEVEPTISGAVKAPVVDKPEADKPEADKPEADKPEADKPEADKPETDKPEADKPEADKPEADEKPVVDEPVVNPSTGDSAVSAVVAVAVLGISAAAVVALRKKED